MVNVTSSWQVMARCVWDTLQSLEENHRKFLLKFLSLTKCTVICEVLQPEYMHIINLSKLKKPLLNAISLTPPAGDESLSSLVAFPPHHTLDLLSSLGFTVPTYKTIQLKDVDRHMDEVCSSALILHLDIRVLQFVPNHLIDFYLSC